MHLIKKMDSKTVAQLKAYARDNGIKGYSGFRRKADLIVFIEIACKKKMLAVIIFQIQFVD